MSEANFQALFDRSRHPRYQGRLPHPDLVIEGGNLSCGDEVHLEIALTNNKVSDCKHDNRSCAVCTVASDILAEKLVGLELEAVRHLKSQDIISNIALELSPTRQRCAELPLQLLKTNLDSWPCPPAQSPD